MSFPHRLDRRGWKDIKTVPTLTYRCGYCSRDVASEKGWSLSVHEDGSGNPVGGVRVCPRCNGASFFLDNPEFQNPSPPLGKPVAHLPTEVAGLYEEARSCSAAGCYTSVVLACRKLLMHIAVAQGAAVGLPFIEYVNYLATNGYVPPNGRGWVDHIRARGNEANHEIVMMGREQADDLLTFSEMLLRFVFEFPARVTPPAATP